MLSLRAVHSFMSHAVIDCAHICGLHVSFCLIPSIICKNDSFSDIPVFCVYIQSTLYSYIQSCFRSVVFSCAVKIFVVLTTEYVKGLNILLVVIHATGCKQ
jgi:hypothetical protein